MRLVFRVRVQSAAFAERVPTRDETALTTSNFIAFESVAASTVLASAFFPKLEARVCSNADWKHFFSEPRAFSG